MVPSEDAKVREDSAGGKPFLGFPEDDAETPPAAPLGR